MEPLNKKIWVVDDDTFLAKIYSDKFQEVGFAVTIFVDGQAAWESFQAGNAPDLLFTGIIMPRMTGFQLIEKLQAEEKLKDLPTVVFSHRGREEDRVIAIKLGVDDFVVQGLIPLVEIVRRVKTILGIEEIYKIHLDPDKPEGRAVIDFFIKQGQLNFNVDDHGKNFYLLLEPGLEKGKFKLKLNVEN